MSTVEQPLNKIAATLVDLQERYAKALEVVEVVRSHHFRISNPGSYRPPFLCDGCGSDRCPYLIALAAFDAVVDDG